MRTSSTMQNGFIFLLIIWNSSQFASGNTAPNDLRFSLGCQAVIPCQQYRSSSTSFKWLYKKDQRSHTIQIFLKDKRGVERHQEIFRPRVKVLHNRSLVINNLTEDDQGLYWCESCFKDGCRKEKHAVIVVKKDVLKETQKTFYITAGSNFTYACQSELTHLKWTFEASNMTALRDSAQGPEFVTSGESIQIINVKKADAGKYTCWTTECDGHMQKLLIINLCVITVHQSEDSSISCAVTCDTEVSDIKPNSTSNVESGTWIISVLADPYGSLNCSIQQPSDAYSTVNSTDGPLHALNKTTGTPTEPEYLIPIIYGTSAAITCLILMALLICYLRPRLQAVLPVQLRCCGLNGRVEEEASVVYSSVVIRTPAKRINNHMSSSHCVYSEIKVQRKDP